MSLYEILSRKLFFRGKNITNLNRELVGKTAGLTSIILEKEKNRIETIYFNFDASHSFNNVLPTTTLNVTEFHLSVPKRVSYTQGEYHLTFNVKFKKKTWSFHSFYDENDEFLLTTVRNKANNRTKGVATGAVQLIESGRPLSRFKKVAKSHPLYQADISKIRKWAENYYKVLMAELKVDLVRLNSPNIQKIEDENQVLDAIVAYFSNDFWPKGMKEKYQLCWKESISELIKLGAFTRDNVGLKLYKILSEKMYANRNGLLREEIGNNFKTFDLSVQELLRLDLLTVDTLELIDKSPTTRDLTFALAALNRHGLFHKYIDAIKKIDSAIQLDVIWALITLHQFNANVNVDKVLFTQICKHSSPKDFALLLSVVIQFESNEHGSLGKENIDLAYQYAKPQFLEAYFEALKETNRPLPSNSKIVSFQDDMRAPLISSHPDRIYLEQTWFIISNKFTKQSNSELLEKLLAYPGSGKELYESVLSLVMEGVFQREEDIEFLQMILESADPIKLSRALNTLMLNDLLKDTDLRSGLLSLLREMDDNHIKVSQSVIYFKKAGLLSMEILPLLKKIKLANNTRSRENLLNDFNQLFGIPEKKALFLPLIMSSANLMSSAELMAMIKFLAFFHNDKNIISLFYGDDDFVRKLNGFLKENANSISDVLHSVREFIKKLENMGLLSSVTLDILLHLKRQDIAILALTRHKDVRDIDLNNFMNMMHNLLEYNLYQGFNNIKSPIQYVVPAYQNISNYCAPTEDIFVMLLNSSMETLQKISRCGSIEELYEQYILYHKQQIRFYQEQLQADDYQQAVSYHQEQAIFYERQIMFHEQHPVMLYQHSRQQSPSATDLVTDNSRSHHTEKESKLRK